MLASITPLGERGRQGHWGVTVAAFMLGAGAGGALTGALGGWVGALLLGGSHAGSVFGAQLGHSPRLAILAAVALLALVIDLGAPRVPGPRRQVDERWLDEFRGWVYGLGYGLQLGLGVSTVVTSAATYVALVAAVLIADPLPGAIVMGSYGAIRGLSLFAAAPVRSPGELFALHVRVARWRGPARIGALAVTACVGATALVGAVS